jgi:hypothetical protein
MRNVNFRTSWSLHNFNDQCEDIRLGNRPNFSDLIPVLLHNFLQCGVSQECN